MNGITSNHKKLRFMFNTAEIFGYVNPMINLAKMLKKRGHEIVFVSNESFRQTIENCDFIYEAKLETNSDSSSPQQWAEYILSTGLTNAKSSIENMNIFNETKILSNFLSQHRICEQNIIKKSILKYAPDIIITNNLLASAESIYSGIPWVGIYCQSPLNMYNSDRLPPFMSGFATNGDPNDWIDFQFLLKTNNDFVRNDTNNYFRQYGFPEITTNFPISKYLNIYNYPLELDYSDIVSVPQNWFRVDSYYSDQIGNGFTGNEFNLPKKFKNNFGKLIYVSMGTLGSTNLDIMKKLVSVLSKSPHRFIVSKGQRGSEYELYDNMWGQMFLPQQLILPKVDLVITHGGNNTITETFYFGKPMIVMPFYYDQYDNAQRIHETGFGIRINVQTFTENELLSAIETLLNDKELAIKLEKVVERIKSDKSLEKAVELIENINK